MITLTAKITLADGTIYDIDKRNILSIDTNIIDRGNIVMPSTGIISNSGTIKFVDYDRKINQLVETNALGDSNKCVIYLSNTIADVQSPVGTFYTSRWDYDSNNREVIILLQDDLIEWQSIEMADIPLSSPTTALAFLENIKGYLEYYYPKFEFDTIDETTSAILQNYEIAYPYLKSGSIWNQFTKICEACGLHIFKNNRNKIVVSYAFRS
jgi:hypothetical protein